MSEKISSNSSKIDENEDSGGGGGNVNRFFPQALDDETKKKKEDCLACRLTGTAGLFFISVYVFSNVRRQNSQASKRVVSLVGAGRLNSCFFLLLVSLANRRMSVCIYGIFVCFDFLN